MLLMLVDSALTLTTATDTVRLAADNIFASVEAAYAASGCPQPDAVAFDQSFLMVLTSLVLASQTASPVLRNFAKALVERMLVITATVDATDTVATTATSKSTSTSTVLGTAASSNADTAAGTNTDSVASGDAITLGDTAANTVSCTDLGAAAVSGAKEDGVPTACADSDAKENGSLAASSTTVADGHAVSSAGIEGLAITAVVGVNGPNSTEDGHADSTQLYNNDGSVSSTMTVSNAGQADKAIKKPSILHCKHCKLCLTKDTLRQCSDNTYECAVDVKACFSREEANWRVLPCVFCGEAGRGKEKRETVKNKWIVCASPCLPESCCR